MLDQSQQPPVRVTSLLRNRTWFALAPVAALAFGLAFWGFGHLDATLTNFERIEKSAQLLKGTGAYAFPRDPWQLVVAQWLIPLVAILTAAKLFLTSLRRDIRVAFAKRSRDHVVVCGVGTTGRRVVELLRARGDRVLAVDLDAESANARAAESLGAPTIAGDAKSAAVLRLAGVQRARMVVACTGDDTTNLEIALLAAEASASSFRFGSRLTAVPEMRADWLFEHFVTRSGASLDSSTAELRVLNTAEKAGRLLCRAPAFASPTILRPQRTDLMIVGFGDMGRAIAAQALRTATALPDRRMRLCIFDAHAEAALAAFKSLQPGLDSVADIVSCDVKLASGDPQSFEPVRTALANAHLAAVVVCLPNDNEALYAASRARTTLDAVDGQVTPVFLRAGGRRKLADMMARTDPHPLLGDRLVPFGNMSELLSAGIGNDETDILARACHEAYVDALPAPSDAPSCQPWDSLPELFKRSNRLFADHLEVKLRAAGLRSCAADEPRLFELRETDIDVLAAAEHWRWLIERRLAGWQYGAVRDDATLRHPLMRDWAELSEDTKTGVRTIVKGIPPILAHVGREIRRERVVDALDADDALESFVPEGDEHLVLMLDVADPAALSLVRQAIAIPNVTLRLAQNGPVRSALAGLTREEIDAVRGRIDGCVDNVSDIDRIGELKRPTITVASPDELEPVGAIPSPRP